MYFFDTLYMYLKFAFVSEKLKSLLRPVVQYAYFCDFGSDVLKLTFASRQQLNPASVARCSNFSLDGLPAIHL